jgi:glycosyltransferase involved in cell wall biosynthesis
MMAFNRIQPDKVRVIRNGIEGGSADCRLPIADLRVGDGSLRRARPTSEEEGALGGLRCPDRSQTSIGTSTSTMRSGFPEGSAFTIGTVGRLSWEKDQQALLEAFGLLKKQVDNACLLIVGDGALRGDLERAAEDLGIANDVQFLGYRDDVPSIMAALDVFVLPSLEEGISLTLLEAMAASRPIVATDVGGNPEVVVDGETGILVPSEDVAALAGAIIKLYGDKELRGKMGAAGRKRVEEHFSLNAMVDAYMALYSSVLEKE